MKRIARISSRSLLPAVLLASLASMPGCTDAPGDALDEGCQTHADCPNPARQRCVPEWGLCVGQTNELGELEDPEDPDAGS
jgi:hypothetical protein